MEGVETEEELELIRQTGCDYIQGFYFYRPMEIDALFDTLASARLSIIQSGGSPCR